MRILSWIYFLFISCLVFASPNLLMQSSAQIDKGFSERTIIGQGFMFRIIADCDKERIRKIHAKVPDGKLERIDYRMTYIEIPPDKTKNKLLNSGLGKKVDDCIVRQHTNTVHYFNEVWSPKKIESEIRFPVFLIKGHEPIIPDTPIGVITHEPVE